MKSIHYTLLFYSYWHCGSGLSAGADVDALVIKDADGLPFVPGRTVKGLVREAAEEISELRGASLDSALLFGKEGGFQSDCFFSNATLEEHDQIVKEDLTTSLYANISATKINKEDGIAEDGSLRKMEVVLPCSLQGVISNIPDEYYQLFADALAFVKQLGLDRNRGLGRCHFHIKKEEER